MSLQNKKNCLNLSDIEGNFEYYKVNRQEEINSKFSIFLNKNKKNSKKRLSVLTIENESPECQRNDPFYLYNLQSERIDKQKTLSKKQLLSLSLDEKEGLFFEFRRNSKNIPRTSRNKKFAFYDDASYSEKDCLDFSFSIKPEAYKEENNQNTLPDSIYKYVLDSIKYLTQSFASKPMKIIGVLESIHADKSKIQQLEKEENILTNKLREMKNSRNKIIAEKISLSNELNFAETNPNDRMITERLGYKGEPNYEYFSIQNKNLTNQEDLETKICQIKFENAKFLENIDMIDEEIVENEQINKNIKANLKNYEKLIESLVKEKNSYSKKKGKNI